MSILSSLITVHRCSATSLHISAIANSIAEIPAKIEQSRKRTSRKKAPALRILNLKISAKNQKETTEEVDIMVTIKQIARTLRRLARGRPRAQRARQGQTRKRQNSSSTWPPSSTITRIQQARPSPPARSTRPSVLPAASPRASTSDDYCLPCTTWSDGDSYGLEGPFWRKHARVRPRQTVRYHRRTARAGYQSVSDHRPTQPPRHHPENRRMRLPTRSLPPL